MHFVRVRVKVEGPAGQGQGHMQGRGQGCAGRPRIVGVRLRVEAGLDLEHRD